MSRNQKGPAESAGPGLSLLKDAVQGLDRISFGAIVICMGWMAGLVAAQVFFRYVLSSSIDSADELSRLFFVWSMFLAIPHGVKSGIHVGIDVIVIRLDENRRSMIARLMSVAGAGLMGFIFYMTVFVVGDKWQDLMPTIEITAAVYYIAVLIATGHAFLHLVVLAWGGPTVWEEASQ